MTTVIVEVDGPVRTITLNRPERRNALDARTRALLVQAFASPAADERVAILRGNGAVFCAGLDLRERLAGDVPGAASPLEPVLDAIKAYPLPVVAVVQGETTAGGTGLALHCDLVIAATSATFAVPVAQVGIAPPWEMARKLLEVAGPVLAAEILLLGDAIPARRMADLGLIFRAVPPEEMEHEVSRVVERLGANAPLALRAIKALLRQGMTFRDGISHSEVDELVAVVQRSADAREGVTARLERREPEFRGE